MPAWGTKAFEDERDRKLRVWFRGDMSAVQCLVDISTVCETWDDLYDCDPVAPQELEHAFVILFLDLNTNAFFVKHRDRIFAAMVMVINGWADSNTLVASADRDDRIKAYVLRNLGLELIPLFAYLIGGYQHMRKISPEMRAFVAHETFDQWEQEHA